MKVLSRVLLIVGVLVLIGALGVLFYGGLEVWKQYIAISANRSRDFMNPLNWMLGGAGLTLAAGFLVGLSLGLPKKRAEQPVASQPGSGAEAAN